MSVYGSICNKRIDKHLFIVKVYQLSHPPVDNFIQFIVQQDTWPRPEWSFRLTVFGDKADTVPIKGVDFP